MPSRMSSPPIEGLIEPRTSRSAADRDAIDAGIVGGRRTIGGDHPDFGAAFQPQFPGNALRHGHVAGPGIDQKRHPLTIDPAGDPVMTAGARLQFDPLRSIGAGRHVAVRIVTPIDQRIHPEPEHGEQQRESGEYRPQRPQRILHIGYPGRNESPAGIRPDDTDGNRPPVAVRGGDRIDGL